MDFPYRLAGRRIPDRPKVLVEAVTTTAESFARELGIGYDEMLLGGRSMGGRMCSMAVSDGLRAAGLVLISYPLHPPGRPDRLRSEHFPAITCPCLFVSGDRDPFGSPTELETATSLIAGTVTHHWIPGADHGLRGRDEEVARVVGAWIESF
jgi:predicted alpha/beta-hydrolase family hydrolase